MSFKPALIVGSLVAAGALSGCVGQYQSNFTVVVENRAANTIQTLANGSEIGQVAAGKTGSFSIRLPESNANVYANGVAPTPTAQVTLAARDLKTGALSADKNVTLSQASPTYVTFSPADFPSSVPTVARFTSSPANPAVNQDITFNATSSTAANGVFAWDFGDGQTGGGVTVTHQYTRAATFTVVLTVTSDNGQSSTSSRTVTVSAALPPASANFTFSPTTPVVNQAVLFTVTAAAGVTGATFTWDFGDGGIASGETVTHQYARAGTFTVTLRVAINGQTATTSRTVTVSANLPAGSVNFSFSPTTAGVSDTVFFNASASTVANATYAWDFGDGSRGSGVTTSHRYAVAGTYTVTLTATNDLGQSVSTSKTIAISATSTQLVADFTFSPTDPSITGGTNTVIFDATPTSAGATAWTWDFGDGSAPVSGLRTSHTFSLGGTWVVRLTVTDSTGRTATTTKNVTVAP